MWSLAAAASVEPRHNEIFDTWMRTHAKVYPSMEARMAALEVFEANDRMIEEHNARKVSFTLGHNAYSDLTHAEFRRRMLPALGVSSESFGGLPVKVEPAMGLAMDLGNVSDVDWAEAGFVERVKDQGRCGACWAFAVVGAIESAFAIGGNPLTSLSEQEFVSCDKEEQACAGGSIERATAWSVLHPLCDEADWPYTSGHSVMPGECPGSLPCSPKVSVAAYKGTWGDEKAFEAAVARQPVAAAIAAGGKAFQFYKKGIFDDASCGTAVDHAILLVGFGTDVASPTPDYWRLKNSWGTSWGEKGFMQLARGKNQCGIASEAAWPVGVHNAPPMPPESPPSPPSPPAPPSLPPPPAPPSLSASEAASVAAAAASLFSLVLALLGLCCSCCGSRKGRSILVYIALGTAPACVALLLSRWSRMSHQLLGTAPSATAWADGWACNDPTADDNYTTLFTPCAVLAFANVLATSAPLWVCSLALHLLSRSTCPTGTRPWEATRHMVCDLLPLLTCVLLVLDRGCDIGVNLLGPLCSNRTLLGGPRLASWTPLAAGFVNSAAMAEHGDWVPSALLGAPVALALGTALLASLASLCARTRLAEQHLLYEEPAALEPWASSLFFLALTSAVLGVPLAFHVDERLWRAARHGASTANGSTPDTAPHEWLEVGASALYPALGLVAIAVWMCCPSRPERRGGRHHALRYGDHAHHGALPVTRALATINSEELCRHNHAQTRRHGNSISILDPLGAPLGAAPDAMLYDHLYDPLGASCPTDGQGPLKALVSSAPTTMTPTRGHSGGAAGAAASLLEPWMPQDLDHPASGAAPPPQYSVTPGLYPRVTESSDY